MSSNTLKGRIVTLLPALEPPASDFLPVHNLEVEQF